MWISHLLASGAMEARVAATRLSTQLAVFSYEANRTVAGIAAGFVIAGPAVRARITQALVCLIFTTTAEVAPWTQAGVARGVSLARRPVDTRTTTARRRFCLTVCAREADSTDTLVVVDVDLARPAIPTRDAITVIPRRKTASVAFFLQGVSPVTRAPVTPDQVIANVLALRGAVSAFVDIITSGAICCQSVASPATA